MAGERPTQGVRRIARKQAKGILVLCRHNRFFRPSQGLAVCQCACFIKDPSVDACEALNGLRGFNKGTKSV